MSFICMRLKIISISKAEHLTSFWWTGLGNSEIAYWLLFWCHVSPLCHRNYKCFCPKQYFFSPDRRQGRVEQAIKSSHRFVETFCCYFGIFPLQGNLAIKRCDILTMLLSPSKSATNKHLSVSLQFNNCFIIRSPSLFFNYLQSDLQFSRKSDRTKEKSVVSFTHEQNVVCSQTPLDDIAHERS